MLKRGVIFAIALTMLVPAQAATGDLPCKAWTQGKNGKDRAAMVEWLSGYLGSGLIDYSQKMTMAAMQIADMNV